MHARRRGHYQPTRPYDCFTGCANRHVECAAQNQRATSAPGGSRRPAARGHRSGRSDAEGDQGRGKHDGRKESSRSPVSAGAVSRLASSGSLLASASSSSPPTAITRRRTYRTWFESTRWASDSSGSPSSWVSVSTRSNAFYDRCALGDGQAPVTDSDRRRAFPQVRAGLVGLAGLEPAASSLSAKCRNRCADGRSRRSRPTVEAEVTKEKAGCWTRRRAFAQVR
jgi:hypothetical protein